MKNIEGKIRYVSLELVKGTERIASVEMEDLR